MIDLGTSKEIGQSPTAGLAIARKGRTPCMANFDNIAGGVSVIRTPDTTPSPRCR